MRIPRRRSRFAGRHDRTDFEFGLPSPIDVQITGQNYQANREVANRLLPKLRQVAGAVDLHIHQAADYPQFKRRH